MNPGHWTGLCPQVVEVETEEIQGGVVQAELHLLVSVSLARCHVEAVVWLPFFFTYSKCKADLAFP